MHAPRCGARHGTRDTMPKRSPKNTLFEAVSTLLYPLVRLLLRNNVSFATFSELVKRVYVRVAENEFRLPGREQTTTRISTITGLTRKQVQALRSEDTSASLLSLERHNRASRVISAWVREGEFHDRRGNPASLPFEGNSASFASLAKRFSGDITARTVLEELEHSGAVTRLKDGRIRLLVNSYIPKTDELEKTRILGTDVRDLISTIDHNITCDPDDTYFQRKVWYDNIPEELALELRDKVVSKAQSALESINRDMSKCDRDITGDTGGTGRKRIVLGIYYLEEDNNRDKQR